MSKNNSPKKRIFSLANINSVPEAQEEEIEEEEECGTMSINNNNINNIFDFIVFATKHNRTVCAAMCD